MANHAGAESFESTTLSRKTGSGVLLLCFGIVIFATLIPWVVLLFPRAWGSSPLAYRFLILIGAGVLAYRRVQNLGPLEPAPFHRVRRWVVSCWVLFLVSALLVFPWLASFAGLVTLVVFAYAWGGSRLAQALWPVWLLLGLGIALPFEYAEQNTKALRSLTLRMSTEFLDYYQIPHLPLGNVIEVSGVPLSIERAFYGLLSLPLIQAFSVLIVGWYGASWVRTLLVLGASIFWTVVANTVWEVVVIWLYYRSQIDLNSGWPAKFFVFVLLIVTLSLVASTNSLIRLILLPFRRYRYELAQRLWNWRVDRIQMKRMEAGREPLDDSDLPDPPVEPIDDAQQQVQPTRFSAFGEIGLACWPVILGFGLLALMQIVWFWPCFKPAPSIRTQAQQALVQEILPQALGPMDRMGFRVEQRGRYRTRSEFSGIWPYKYGLNAVEVSVDFPLYGWSELGDWFNDRGWWTESRSIESDSESGAFLESVLFTAPGRHGFLVYRQFDSEGQALEIPKLRPAPGLVSWLDGVIAVVSQGRRGWRQEQLGTFTGGYQVHVFVESPRPLTVDEKTEVRSLLKESCDQVRSALRHASSEAKR